MAIPRIPTHKQWLEETRLGVLHPRSEELRMVDEAILQYERYKSVAALGKIKIAFEVWKRKKSAGWENNERNRSGALTRLDKELQCVQAACFTPEELRALRFIAENRKQVIRNLFQGKAVALKGPKSAKEALQNAANEVTQTGQKAADWLRSVAKAPPMDAARMVSEKLENMVKEMFQVDTLAALGDLASFIQGILQQCSVSMSPVLGHIKDGYDMIVGWGRVGRSLYQQHNIAKRSYVIDTGAPAAAFDALKRCLVDETRTQAAETGIATTAFLTKTGFAFLDGGAVSGPVVGAVKALSQVSLKVHNLASEYQATKRANEILRSGPLDIRLFETYPLMGCYLLTSATLSDIVPIDCFGMPGWMDYIEDLKRRGYEGIYNAATNLMESSLWEIRGMPKRPVKRGTLGFGGTTAPGLAGDLMQEVFKF